MSGKPHMILEELTDDGAWIAFDRSSFLAEKPGEYSVILRVRSVRNSDFIKAMKAKRRRRRAEGA